MSATPRVYTTDIAATPEAVWTALTTPAQTRLYFDFIAGYLAVESDWTVGGPVVSRAPDGEAAIAGTVFTVEPPFRLATTFALLYDDEVRRDRPSRLTWQITPIGEVCKLAAIHDEVDGETRTVRDAAACLPAILGKGNSSN
jgi:uncharacterized protein YndB with AHSA1/START domain